MKRSYILAIFLMLLTANVLFAQEHKITVQNTKEGSLTLDDFSENLPIEGYSGNEIIITSSDDRFANIPARAKGLKPVYPGGTDNTGLALNVQQNGNDVTIRCLLPIEQEKALYKIKVPDNLSIHVKSGCERNNSVTIQNMKNEIEVNVCENIKLKNVSGPLELSNISGTIEVVFGDLLNNKPISMASVSGEIDVTLPAKAAVNLEMNTVDGSMFSDFDLNTDKKDMQRVGGNSLKAKLNGGGTDLKITTVSGNTYLRKG